MPLYEFLCADCGAVSEVLVTRSDEVPSCESCGSEKLKKLMSAQSSASGVRSGRMPGPGDTRCCGSTPEEAGCAGPGSCCGHDH